MAKRITLRLPDAAHDTIRNYANADRMSMNSWVEGMLDVEDIRRRCQMHALWLQEHPAAVEFSAAWADRNVDDLTNDIAAAGRVVDDGNGCARYLLNGV